MESCEGREKEEEMCVNLFILRVDFRLITN